MVSSTFRHLKDHRSALIRAIEGQGLHPVAMEQDSARPDGSVLDSSLQKVRDSAAYVGIIGRGYGQVPESVDNPSRRSLTELEFREARRLGRPILIFIMGPDHLVVEAAVEQDPERRRKLNAFREEVKKVSADSAVHRVYCQFNDLHEFEVAVTQAVAELRRHLDRHAEPTPDLRGEGNGSAPAQPNLGSLPPIEPPFGLRTAPLRGRSGLLRELEAVSGRSGVDVIYGVGGVGKTRLALEAAHHARSIGTRVWWIPGTDIDSFEAGMYAVGYAVGVGMDDFQYANPADVVWRALGSLADPWLLVIDNVDDVTVISRQGSVDLGQGWIRSPRQPGRVIVTSRDGRVETWADWTDRRRLDPLEAEEAGQVLLDLAPRAGSESQAAQLGQQLSGIPLLLQLAGSTLAQADSVPRAWQGPGTLRGFADYEAALTVEHGAGEPGLSELESDIRPVFERAWEISLDQLQKTGQPHARALLLLVCCFADASMPYESLLDPAALARSGLFDAITPIELMKALQNLDALGLLTLSPPAAAEPAALTLHPVIRAAARAHHDFIKSSGAYWKLASDLLLNFADWIDDDDAGAKAWTRITPHVAEAMQHLPQGAPTDSGGTWRMGYVLSGGADQLASHGLHRHALTLYDVLAVDESAEGSRNRRKRARMLRELGRHVEALVELDATIAATGELLGVHDVDTLDARRDRARLLRETGRHAEALAEIDDVLAISQRVHADKPRYTLVARQERAKLLRETGHHAEALDELDAVLDANRTQYGEQHEETLVARIDRARVLREVGRHAEALAELNAVLGVRREMHGNGHFTVLLSRFDRAQALRSIGRHVESLKEFDSLISVWREMYGDWHPYVLITREERVQVLQSIGRDIEALREVDTMLPIWRGMHGDNHAYFLISRQGRARILRTIGRYAEALYEFRSLLKIWQRMHADGHAYILITRYEQALVLRSMQCHAEALNEFDEVLSAWSDVYEEKHSYVLATRADRASALRGMGRFVEALAEFDAVLAARREVSSGLDFGTLAIRLERARVLREAGRSAEALIECDAVLAAYRQLNGDLHAAVLDARLERVRILRKRDRRPEALAECEAVVADWNELEAAMGRWALGARYERARLLREMGRHDMALDECDAVLEAWGELGSARFGPALDGRFERARVLHGMARHTEAQAELGIVFRERRALSGADHPRTVEVAEFIAGAE
jgi:tetratricopeptide (TPR) repeat protein